jgi:nucleotide-binding universal stress UspA family protein
MIKRILVPIDGSEPSIKALDYALDLAENLEVEVVILSVVRPVTLPIFPMEDNVAPIVTAQQSVRYAQKAKELYENVLKEGLKRAKSRKPNLKITGKLAEGRPGDKIIEIAEEEGFDLVVMGSRGLSGLSEVLLGSITNKVAHHSKTPLLIIK